MNISRIVIEKEEKSTSVIVAATLSKAAEANDEMEERCDEVRKMMSEFKNHVK